MAIYIYDSIMQAVDWAEDCGSSLDEASHYDMAGVGMRVKEDLNITNEQRPRYSETSRDVFLRRIF